MLIPYNHIHVVDQIKVTSARFCFMDVGILSHKQVPCVCIFNLAGPFFNVSVPSSVFQITIFKMLRLQSLVLLAYKAINMDASYVGSSHK
jgi:hypothetical protein